MWHNAYDMSLVMLWGVNILSKIQLHSSYGLYFEDLVEKADSITDWINYQGVCRIAPATPGLLINHTLNIPYTADTSHSNTTRNTSNQQCSTTL